MIRTSCILAVALLLAGAPAGQAQVFLVDDPLREDADTLLSAEPAEQELSDIYDFVENTFGREGSHEGPALDVNTLGEVPNSSWYTNRHYARRMSPGELRRGSLRGDGPQLPWAVISGKTEGKTLGMLIEDTRGDRYLLKFDPKGFLELSTAAEAVVTPIFYALGYEVPENYLARFRRDDLRLTDESRVSAGLVDTLVGLLDSYPDGTYRALASKYVRGKPIGPFKYYGTRADDPNDVIPHEARRELRGLRVFMAWLNHDDSRAINTLDAFVGDSTGGYVQHFLADFNATLGAGVRGPKPPSDDTEFSFHPSRILARLFTLNLARGAWMSREYTVHPSVGRYDYAHFDPTGWRQQYPNPSFSRMDRDDAFWGARQVMHFTDDEIRTFVAAGQLSDPEAAAYLARALMERRDRIGAEWLGWGGGLDRFRLDGSRLLFDDLLAMHGLDGAGTPRTTTWHPFDNASGVVGAAFSTAPVTDGSVLLPSAEAAFLVARIATPGLGATAIALRRAGRAYEVVGIDRCTESEACGVFGALPRPAVAQR